MSRLDYRRRSSRALAQLAVVGLIAACATLASCAPTVGSPRWCEVMKEKPRGDWTANEALDFARHCVIANDNWP
jgi:hypothetical protein